MRQPIIVEHRRLTLDDSDVIHEFEQSIAGALREGAQRQKLTVEEASEQLQRTILKRIFVKAALLITPKAVAQIYSDESVGERRMLAENISNEISTFVYRELVGFSGLPGRGPTRKFADRDRKVFQMRRNGTSYGRIGIELHIPRNAVQAAFRRERGRRNSLLKCYPRLKQALHSIGIVLKEH